jgi:DNA-binding response OmpR family regulator
MRILVVEDDTLIGLLLAEVLTDLGHDVCGIEVTEAGAIAAAARYHPDLMIVDVWLSDGNGISAIAEILRAGPMPHFFVSGDVASIHRLKPDAPVVQKPFREQELVQAIARAVSAPAPLRGAPATRQ